MKSIVWIAAFLLAVSGVAHGQRIELPEGETTTAPGAEPAAVVDEEPTTAEPTEAQPAPTVPTTGERRARRLAPTGYPMGFMAEPAARRAPTSRARGGFGMTTTGAVAPTEVRTGRKFNLFGITSQATYGPFEFRDEGRIRLPGEQYVIRLLGAGAETVDKTPEQTKLEGKLRRATVPDIAFEDAPLMQVVDFLSREADVNIVVTKPVQETEVTITLRLRNIPLYDAIRYVTEVVGLWFRIDDHAVVITEHPAPIGGEIPLPGTGSR